MSSNGFCQTIEIRLTGRMLWVAWRAGLCLLSLPVVWRVDLPAVPRLALCLVLLVWVVVTPGPAVRRLRWSARGARLCRAEGDWVAVELQGAWITAAVAGSAWRDGNGRRYTVWLLRPGIGPDTWRRLMSRLLWPPGLRSRGPLS